MSRDTRTLTIALVTLALAGSAVEAALIGLGDPTAELDGTLFLDDASTGGDDSTIGTTTNVFTIARFLDLDGAPGAPGAPGFVTIQGFGFATNNSSTQNTATSVTLTFTYLGADEAGGGGDDIVLGTETVDWNNGTNPGGWEGAGTYFVNLDSDPSAVIDGLGERFRVTIAADNGQIRFKIPNNGSAQFGHKLSFSGTFAAIPEVGTPLAMGAVTATGLVRVRRRTRSNS